MIRDGMGMMIGSRGMPTSSRPGEMENNGKVFGHAPTSTPPIQGNGEPVIAGSVASINGTTLTVTNASNVTYTVDTSNAKIVKNGTITAITNVTTGDNIMVQGTVNGTSVAASSVIDQGNGNLRGGAPANTPSAKPHFDVMGALGNVGNFLKHIFGF